MKNPNLGQQFNENNVFSLDASKKAGRAVSEETPEFRAHADEAMAMGNSGVKKKKKSIYNKAMDAIGLGETW